MTQSKAAGATAPARETARLAVAFIAEDEPFYLAQALAGFLGSRPDWLDVTAAVVLDYAPTRGDTAWWRDFGGAVRLYGVATVARAYVKYLRGRLAGPRVAGVFTADGVPTLAGIGDVAAPEVADHLRRHRPDLIVSVGVNQLFGPSILDLPALGCINVHLGLLPRHRGPAPLFWAMHDGDPEIGVSVHWIEHGRIDGGAVIARLSRPLDDKCFDRQYRAMRFLSMKALGQALDTLRRDPEAGWLPDEEALPYRSVATRADIRRFLAAGNRFFD